MAFRYRQVIAAYKANKKVVENYLFMTALQVLSSLFYVLIYPYLIRKLGAESYGLYVFATSIVTYFVTFIGFGFDFPAVRAIAENENNEEVKRNTLSCVFTAKIYLLLISSIIFSILLLSVPYLRSNCIIFFICFAQVLYSIFFPQWFFQGIQQMKVVTYIQLFFKIVSLPFIFLLIKAPTDLWIFVSIVSLSNLLGAVVAFFNIQLKHQLKVSFRPLNEVMDWYKKAAPFFLSASTSIIKEQSITVIIGAFFGMRDVAIYDLANKIILLPRILFVNINGALFPKIIANVNLKQIRKVIRYEYLLGVLVIFGVAAVGNWLISFMGGKEMLAAYPLSIILSITVMVWLVVGAYIAFIFVPQNRYYYVTKNQLVALISFIIYCSIGLLFYKNILVLGAAIALSGLTEIIYCKFVISKDGLLTEKE